MSKFINNYRECYYWEDDKYLIKECEYRGAEVPFYELYLKCCFLWNKFISWSVKLEKLMNYIKRCENFDTLYSK